MLTLFTGAPGAGKGMAGVDLVRKLVAGDGGGLRPLYVLEVPEVNVKPLALKLPHTLLGPGEVERWHEIVPDGAVVYAPEAQRIWPARSPSAKVPLHVEAVGQHRHRNIEMVLDTQGEKLIDEKVRLRVGRHVHLRDLGILGRHWYEWPELGTPARWKSAPIKKRFRMGKGVQDLYHSATGHIKPVRSFPPSMYVIAIGGILLLAIASKYGYRLITTGSIASPDARAGATAAAGAASAPSAASGMFGGLGRSAAGAAYPIAFPVYSAQPVKAEREPFDGRALQFEGGYTVRGVERAFFGVLVAGQRVATVTLEQLLKSGYVWTALAPCAGLLRFGDVERMVTCRAGEEHHQEKSRLGKVEAVPSPVPAVL